jgi:hypothetical protein
MRCSKEDVEAATSRPGAQMKHVRRGSGSNNEGMHACHMPLGFSLSLSLSERFECKKEEV